MASDREKRVKVITFGPLHLREVRQSRVSKGQKEHRESKEKKLTVEVCLRPTGNLKTPLVIRKAKEKHLWMFAPGFRNYFCQVLGQD